MISEELIEYVKNYMKIDEEGEELLPSFILASKESLEISGVKFDEENELHRLTLAMLTSQRYEDRLGNTKGNNAFILNSLIIQISE